MFEALTYSSILKFTFQCLACYCLYTYQLFLSLCVSFGTNFTADRSVEYNLIRYFLLLSQLLTHLHEDIFLVYYKHME